MLVRPPDRMMARRSLQLILTPPQVTTELTWRPAWMRFADGYEQNGRLAVYDLRGSLRVVRCLAFRPVPPTKEKARLARSCGRAGRTPVPGRDALESRDGALGSGHDS